MEREEMEGAIEALQQQLQACTAARQRALEQSDSWQKLYMNEQQKHMDTKAAAAREAALLQSEINHLRLERAGAIGLLCEISVFFNSSTECKPMIVEAVEKWCEDTGWTMVQTLDRVEVFPPEPKEVSDDDHQPG